MQGGLTAVLIESELVGGECSYWACMPSKALLRSGHALRAAQRVRGAREAVTGELDVAAVFARRNEIVHDWDDASQVTWVHDTGIGLLRGHGRITGEKRVSVTADDGTVTELTARHAVVVSTGSDPLIPSIPGLDTVTPWTPRDATSAQVAPKSLAIIGGGVVAVEMATAYATFGTTVTIIARSGILRGQEDFASDLVGAGPARPRRHDRQGRARAGRARRGRRLDPRREATRSSPSTFSIATGRTPRSTDIGLETIGLKPGDWLTVDDTLRVDGLRLALRDRRREPSRAAHPPGQVPGACVRRRDRRACEGRHGG